LSLGENESDSRNAGSDDEDNERFTSDNNSDEEHDDRKKRRSEAYEENDEEEGNEDDEQDQEDEEEDHGSSHQQRKINSKPQQQQQQYRHQENRKPSPETLAIGSPSSYHLVETRLMVMSPDRQKQATKRANRLQQSLVSKLPANMESNESKADFILQIMDQAMAKK
jgi:hypothetical protein